MINLPVLVLNQNYEPLNVCDVRRAVVLMDKGKAEILENGRGDLRTFRMTYPVPTVIRLFYMVKRPLPRARLSRREVFLRDRNTCQYCGAAAKDLTLDHVIPRHRGGQHTWENVVSACNRCNNRKAARTPHEAGMALSREPRPPKPNPYHIFRHRSVLDEWRPFIPWA